MSEDWFDRFKRAIDRDPRPARQISLAAGLGVNYVQQSLKDGKKMSADNLIRILDVLGSASALYIFTGIDLTGEEEEVFRLLSGLDPKLRSAALAFFRDLKDREES